MRPNHTSSNALSLAPIGYRLPAEWEPHAATWLAWPHYRGDWPGRFEPIPWVYAEMIRHLAPHERVEVIVNNARSEQNARQILSRADALSENVGFHRWPTNRAWIRDSGCIFLTPSTRRVKRGGGDAHRTAGATPGLRALKWRFTAWAKYPNWQHDEKVGALIAQSAQAEEVRPLFRNQRVVLEGGSIDVNGQGALLTTEECLLSRKQQRNPGMKRADYEKVLADYLGIRKVIWLGRGIAGDDTHGHVDDITRFVAPDAVVTVVESNRRDANYEPLQDNLRRLRAATDQDGRRLRVIELPMPRPVHFEGVRLPASYGNFYIANGVVLVPVFNDPKDRIALNTLGGLFPGRSVVGIYSGDFIWGLGAMHCMTQQQPEFERRSGSAGRSKAIPR
jgi:agmatine deiminase